MSSRRYFHDGYNSKFKVIIKRALPCPYKHFQNWHKWVRFPLPKHISLVFTRDYVLFKKYNKKLLEIPYDDISNWGDYGSKYWNFTWRLSDNTKIYKHEEKFRVYFDMYERCIIYLTPKKLFEPKTFNNTMNSFKIRSHSKQPRLLHRRRFTV